MVPFRSRVLLAWRSSASTQRTRSGTRTLSATICASRPLLLVRLTSGTTSLRFGLYEAEIQRVFFFGRRRFDLVHDGGRRGRKADKLDRRPRADAEEHVAITAQEQEAR